MRRAAMLVVALGVPLTGCASRAPRPVSARIPGAWRFATPASPTTGQHAMVVSEHPLASEIGAEIMRRGGNAIDAAVAVGFALAVVNPRAGNLGGGGFLVYRASGGATSALDFRETAPAAANRSMYLDSAGNVGRGSLEGALAAGVPGSVAGLEAMHRRLGRLPWREVVMPAVRLARDGFLVDSTRARTFTAHAERLRRYPSSVAAFLPGGNPAAAGSVLRQPDLAHTLQLIADSGAAGFYRGAVADLIVAEMGRSGGIITHQDLASYRAIWREPIHASYRGWRIISVPPASSGGITMAEMLNVLEGFRRLPPFGSAALMHLEIEAMRRAFTDRNRFLGDPDFVAMPIARLTSKAYAGELRRQIRRDRATPSAQMPAIVEGQETTHYSIVDPDGNAAAVTTTINDSFGSALTVTGAGFLLNNEMDDFTVKPGTPNLFGLIQGEANAIQPGKRMLSAMSPTIVLDLGGHLALVLGSPGGPTIISTVAQVISNVVDHRMSLADAIFAPRIHHQGLPDSLRWEPDGIALEERRTLEAMGHHLFVRPAHMGVVNAVRVTSRGLEGVPDPRTAGGAAGW